jgi:hypothetical protein
MVFGGAAARSQGRRASDASIGGRLLGLGGYLNSHTKQGLVIAAISGVLLWLVWIYGNGLRDPNYFNGWMLAGGMGLQLYFHIALKTSMLSPKSAMRWRKIHIFVGYLLIAAFLSHTDFSLPDSGFEWALWAGFMLVTVSGIFGTYLAWSVKAKRRVEDGVTYDRIPARYAELAQEVQETVIAKTNSNSAAIAVLPGLPHDAWIVDLYNNHLQDFFDGQRNASAHFFGSQRPLKRVTDEIDNLSGFVDQESQEKLAAIKSMVIEKDRLDFARVYLGLTRSWLLVHVPITYALMVLAVLHVLVAYAFSSGAW